MSGMMMLWLMMLAGSNAGDLLDYTPTDDYWQMRDQRIVDVQTMSAVLVDDQATATDRLMAIRAVGELSKTQGADKAALTQLLTPLVDSKEPFVGQYAKRSLAWIKGEDPAPRPRVTAEQLAADLALLPATSTIVGQLKMDLGVAPVDLAAMIPDFEAGRGNGREQMIQQISGGILQVVQMIGNARIDSVSVGHTFLEPNGGDDGYAVIIARGQYDRINVQMAIEKLSEEENADLNLYSIGQIEIVASSKRFESFVMMMPSDELFVFMFGGGRENIPFPIDQTVAVLRDGGGPLGFNTAVSDQLKQIDRDKADAWVALEVPGRLRDRQKEMFGPFTAGRAMALRGENGAVDMNWTVDGDDAGAIAEVVQMLNEGIASSKADITREMERMPQMKSMFEPMAKMLESLKVVSDGKAMTGEVKMPGGGGAMMPMFMMRMPMRHDNRVLPAEDAGDAVEDAGDF